MKSNIYNLKNSSLCSQKCFQELFLSILSPWSHPRKIPPSSWGSTNPLLHPLKQNQPPLDKLPLINLIEEQLNPSKRHWAVQSGKSLFSWSIETMGKAEFHHGIQGFSLWKQNWALALSLFIDFSHKLFKIPQFSHYSGLAEVRAAPELGWIPGLAFFLEVEFFLTFFSQKNKTEPPRCDCSKASPPSRLIPAI